MKILVLLSQVPDTTARIAFTNGNTQLGGDNIDLACQEFEPVG